MGIDRLVERIEMLEGFIEQLRHYPNWLAILERGPDLGEEDRSVLAVELAGWVKENAP